MLKNAGEFSTPRFNRYAARVEDPATRLRLSDAYHGLAEALREEDIYKNYKNVVDVALIGCFGDRAQLVDLEKPIVLNLPDRRLLLKYEDLITPLGTGDQREITRVLNGLPTLKGSLADQGVFDGYNQELLFGLSALAGELSDKTANPAVHWWDKLWGRKFRSEAQVVDSMIESYREGDRDRLIQVIFYSEFFTGQAEESI